MEEGPGGGEREEEVGVEPKEDSVREGGRKEAQLVHDEVGGVSGRVESQREIST